jgi:hypothetical protein
MTTSNDNLNSDQFHKYTRRIINRLQPNTFTDELLSALKVRDISIRYYNNDAYAYTIIIEVAINNIVIKAEFEGSINSDYMSRITYKVIEHDYNDTIITTPIKSENRHYDSDDFNCSKFEDENIVDKIDDNNLRLAHNMSNFNETSFEQLRDFIIKLYSLVNVELFLDIADDKNIFGICL